MIMKYMGGKSRIAKYIVPLMLKERRDGQWWVEPFVGGGSVISRVDGLRLGSDANHWTIQALTSIRDHVLELPRNNLEFTEDDRKRLWNDDSYPHKGYAGFAFSFGGTWRGGWSRDAAGSDYVLWGYNSAMRQSPLLQGVRLEHSCYRELTIPPKSLIYCDPPYAGTRGYGKRFNSEEFWEWCREKDAEGHTVFISEYKAPDDFRCVWEREQKENLALRSTSKHTLERLFRRVGDA